MGASKGRKKPDPRAGLPQPPDGLHESATALWWSILDDFDLETHELTLLREACRTVDRIQTLEDRVDADGMMVAGSKGQEVLHPALAEARQQRLTLGRILNQLRLPEGEDDGRRSALTSSGRQQRRGGFRGLYSVGGP